MGKRGGGSSGGGGGGAPSNAKELKMFLRNRMWRDHWQVLTAVGVIVVALFASAFLQFSYSKEHVYRLEVSNEAFMERVFRSGEPWVVLCSKPDDLVPEFFSKSSKRLVDKSFMGVLDCSQKFPGSQKTVYQRFGLSTAIHPTIFTVSNGEKPKQIPLNYLQSSKAFSKHVIQKTRKKMREILKTLDLEKDCLQKNKCLLILRSGKKKFNTYEKQWLHRLMEEDRTLHIAWMNAGIFKLSIDTGILPKDNSKKKEHRLLLIQRQDKNTLKAKGYRHTVVDYLPVKNFLEESKEEEDMKVLTKRPTVSTRTRNTSKNKKKSTTKKTKEKTSYTTGTTTNDETVEDIKEQQPKWDIGGDKDDDYYFAMEVERDHDDDQEQQEEEEVIDLDE